MAAAKIQFRSFARFNSTCARTISSRAISSISGKNFHHAPRDLNSSRKMATLASFKIPKVANEPNVSIIFGEGDRVL